MSNYFIHIPKTAGNSIFKSLCDTDILTIGHDLRSAEYKHPSEICTPDDFVFTFVRNPYTRVLSAYSYLLKGGIIPDDAKDAYYLGIRQMSFVEFIHKRLIHASEWQIHFVPQSYFLKNVTNCTIYKYENLQNSFDIICKKFNSPIIELPKLNTSEWKDDFEKHFTPEAISIVNEIYSSDFEIFKYLKL